MSQYLIPTLQAPYAINLIHGATFVIGAEATNAITVAVQLQNQQLNNLGYRGFVHWYLTSDVTGDTLATAASGGVAGGTNGVVKQVVTGIYGFAVSEAAGTIDIVVTDSSARTVYLNVVMPDGSIVVSPAITFV